MRTIVNATVTFGAITVPVGVASAGTRGGVELNTIHVCGTKMQQQYLCPKCGVIGNSEDTGKGYKIGKDKYVWVNDEEFKEITAERVKTIEIAKFVDAVEIQPQMVEKRYFLTPSNIDAFVRPYELLASALVHGLAGIGKARLWGKEYPVSIEVNPIGLLTMATLFCADEMPPPGDELSKLKGDISTEELKLMSQFVGLRSSRLEPSDLTSATKEKQIAYIDAVLTGSEITQPDTASEPEPTINLLEKLKEMVQ